MIDFDSSDSDDESSKAEQLPSEKPSSAATDLEQFQSAVQQRVLSPQRAAHSHALSDEPALFSLQLNVTALDESILDESLEDITTEGDTVPFYTGNPAIQKFKGHVCARAVQFVTLCFDFTGPNR